MESQFSTEKYITIFIEETIEDINEINNLLIELEKEPDNQKIKNNIKRKFHNIKGSANMVGLSDIAKTAHEIEDLISNTKESITKEIFDKIFKTIDNINKFTSKAGTVIKDETNNDKISNQDNGKKSSDNSVIKNEQKKSETIRLKINKLDNLVRIIDSINSVNFEIEKNINEAEDFETYFTESLKKFHNTRNSIIDSFYNNISKNKLFSKVKNLLNDYDNKLELKKKLYDSFFLKYKNNFLKLNTLYDQLLDTASGLRLVPLSKIFDLFPRLARDISSDCGKKVNLIIDGKDVEIDQLILDKIKDPLVHILRNCIDHGIEKPDVRKKLGKNETGKIYLKAHSQGKFVYIKIKDNGKGIDAEQIRQTALNKNLITAEEAKDETINILSYIFYPGFSTSDTVTEISGRGVGMDVVKKNIEDLNGEIIVDTKKGKGTTFTIFVPLTIAVVHVLIFKIAKQILSFPIYLISDIIILDKSKIKIMKNQRCFTYKNKIIPLYVLGDLLQIQNNSMENKQQQVIIVKYNNEELGFLVDDVINQRDIVIKPIKGIIGQNKIISGVTIYDENIPIVVLNIPEIINLTKDHIIKITNKKIVTKTQKRILLVEDSITIRELEKSILTNYNFYVDTAEDGLIAYNKLINKNNNYDLIISDIDMPNMNGLELLKKIRKNKDLKSIPVIIVSTYDDDNTISKAKQLGVVQYITKSDFEKDKLLNIINNFKTE